MSNLSVFVFESQEIRVVSIENEPWFVAKDVCEGLTIPWKGGETLNSIPERWKTMSPEIPDSQGRTQSGWVIKESGVYKLAFRSNKPEADRLTNWIAEDVLPSIRRTGKYEITQTTPQQNTKPTLDELVNFGQKVLAGTRLSAELQTITIVRGVQALYPEIAPMAKELVGAIGEIIATPERHLTPTAIGELYAERNGLSKPIKAHIVNRVLEAAGFQYKTVELKTNSNGKQSHKNTWHLTETGKKWGTVVPDKARTHDKIIEHVKWLPDVLDVIDLNIVTPVTLNS
ncbi:BRO-N domain-containing protein [Nodularia sp. NIES-3585]|uniref:BRO-N domain-containing protein n=1 Tax=Nodularia sp. NIES-3585 TaxID=1973477 RepID=UPI000B5CB847|nr:BRO family protein [Nodularia sp. NIES-3585]GAX38858.1 prophage antirepressor [Nodularia sp. NIES-3585]